MLREALEKLESLAVSAAGAAELKIGHDPYRKYVAIHGQIEEIELDPPPRRTQPATVADLWTMAADLLDARCDTEIWVGQTGVALIHARADRRDVSECRFQSSRQHAAITSLCLRDQLTQTALVRMLRFDLGAPLETVLPFRRIVWSVKGATQGTAAAASAAYGKTIEQEVTGNEPMPEIVRLDAPLWDTPGEKAPYRFELGVEYNHTEQTLSIAPLPGSLEAAIAAHQEDVYDRLRDMLSGRGEPAPDEGTVTIFRGEPS